MLPKITERTIEVKLTESEIKEVAEKMARQIEARKRLEEEKKAVTSEMTAKINEATAIINMLANTYNTGFEERLVECEIEYNLSGKQKTIIDPNTGRTVDRLKLEPWEIEELSQPKLPGL